MNTFQRWWMNAFPHRWHLRRHVPKFLRLSPEQFRGEVLEVGAGGGWTSRQVLETCPQVELTATDIDPGARNEFEALRTTYGRRLKMREANAMKLPFDRDSFDIVLAINIVPFLPPFGVRKALQEFIRVTRPGGLIGVSDHLLFSISRHSRRGVIEDILTAENCDILVAQGDGWYDIWARKAYPINQQEP
ncbi:MAG: class I SAM-dependent methyltransferase [Candidatus Andersenbacteria bacterium]